MKFKLNPFNADFYERQVLGVNIEDFLAAELAACSDSFTTESNEASGLDSEWEVEIGGNLLFDRHGLNLMVRALRGYCANFGNCAEVNFVLLLDEVTGRDYYPANEIHLPVVARRKAGEGRFTLEVKLPAAFNFVPFPAALTAADNGSVPEALLIVVADDFDILFANQIALLIKLKEKIKRDWKAFLKSPFNRAYKSWPLKVGTAFKEIHPSCEVHPTAVIEGSIIEEGTRIGAHTVVRFSHIGKNVRLHDGAKVELSFVGENSWLMHDLVLYRSYTEDHVFLIHGPYQFSGFQSGSGAFGTIMMDYRPDQKPIRKNYRGRFLGSILKPGAKTLGGSLIAPGQIVAANRWLTSEIEQIHSRIDQSLPEFKILPPSLTRSPNNSANH